LPLEASTLTPRSCFPLTCRRAASQSSLLDELQRCGAQLQCSTSLFVSDRTCNEVAVRMLLPAGDPAQLRCVAEGMAAYRERAGMLLDTARMYVLRVHHQTVFDASLAAPAQANMQPSACAVSQG
jgi:hypothetical protein